MSDRWNPRVRDACPICRGWGFYSTSKDPDEEADCLACGGTGTRVTWPTCDVVPGNPAAWWRKATCGCEINVCWGHRRMQIEAGSFHCGTHNRSAQWFLEKELRA